MKPQPGSYDRRIYPWIGMCAIFLCLMFAPIPPESTASNVEVLLIGSYSGGPDNWVTRQSFTIENLLKFNGIPYEFFDISAQALDQARLDQYVGVILEGHSMYFCATEVERSLLAANMESGGIIVLLGSIHGEYAELNSTLYDAMDVWVDGLGNDELSVRLKDGASRIYGFCGDGGSVITGGCDAKHVGIGVKSLGDWTCGNSLGGQCMLYGTDLALSTWMENAFGVDARVTLPMISLRLDDTQTTLGERPEAVMDFIDDNKHRIRASGFLVTDLSAYQGSDSTLQNDEQIISLWGSMSLHGKNHASVGAEGFDRDYQIQYSDMNDAVSLLLQNFPRYKPMKACPNNSWNAATLHAMYDNGIYYHSACISKSDEYKALYKSLFDVDSELDRERMYTRAICGLLGYYPLVCGGTSVPARIYSVDWGPVINAAVPVSSVLTLLRSYALDWWTPVLIGAHFRLEGNGGVHENPTGWMAVMAEVMQSVDSDSYTWRRWVDSHDFAKNLDRFDCDLEINSISISGDVVTYNISATQPIRFLTLRAERWGDRVKSVILNGTPYAYFGDNYVHLPEINGDVAIEVTMTSNEDCEPHVVYIEPSGVIESAQCEDDLLDLVLSGEFEVIAEIRGSSDVFRHGTTRVFADGTAHLQIDVSSQTHSRQTDLSLALSSGWVDATIDTWETAGTNYRKWSESTEAPDIQVMHALGGLVPNSCYTINIDGNTVDSCTADHDGRISFNGCPGCSSALFEVIGDSASMAGTYTPRSESPEPIDGSMPVLLSQPNPLESRTTILYRITRPCRVRLSIYSVRGEVICDLVDRNHTAGHYTIDWDGLSSSKDPVSPGIYFCRMLAGSRRETRRIVLVK